MAFWKALEFTLSRTGGERRGFLRTTHVSISLRALPPLRALLPELLQDENPQRVWRQVDGQWTQADVEMELATS